MNRKKVEEKKMILYHAISAYQLFEVIVHRKRYHKNDYAVLLLPDFIVNKYPNWKQLEKFKLFDEVHLFAYMLIPHNEETVLNDLDKQYHISLKYSIDVFSEIYVAGAHFYFSIYLIENQVPFVALEDAAGMLEQGKRLSDNLKKTFPIHAKIIEHYKMFELKNEFVKYVICNKRSKEYNSKVFRVNKQFRRLNKRDKKKIYLFFEIDNKKIDVKNSIILLTQNFTGLGVMTLEEQKKIYIQLSKFLKEKKLYVKAHPDDVIDYKKIFENAEFLPQKVPMEVLISLFKGKPKKIITFSSTASASLDTKFCVLDFSQNYNRDYDFGDEFHSITKILSKLEKRKWKL